MIRKEDSAAWHDEDTNDVHETMRACRAYIDSNRTVHADAKNMYTYIEEHATAENSADAVLYRRYGKCLDIGGYVFDANGRATVYTGNATIAEEEEAIIESMHLTQKQARVLTLRRQGYGIRSIGQYYGVSFQAIAKTMSQIRKKAADIGLKEEAEAQRAQREAEAEGAEMIAIVNAYDRQRAHEAHDSAKRTAERRARQSEARRTLIDRVAQREAEAQREAIDRTEAQPQSEAEAQRRAAEAEAERRAAQSEAERRAAQRTARRTLVDRVAQREAEAQRAQREAERRAAQSEAEREAERRAAEARAEAETIRSAWTEANRRSAEAQRAEAEAKRISSKKFRTWTERRAAEAEAINHWNEAERRAAEAKRAAQRAQREAERRAAQSYTEAHR